MLQALKKTVQVVAEELWLEADCVDLRKLEPLYWVLTAILVPLFMLVLVVPR